MGYVLGLDNGGTSTKAVLFDTSGRQVASAKRQTAMSTPRPGFTERDMEELWAMNCQVIRETVASSGVDPADILGVSFSGHGKGLYLWGKDGKPARPGIVSTDSRAQQVVEDWQRQGVTEKAFARTCQSVLPSQPVALLKWIKENEPQVLDNTRWVFGVKDYIRFRMTGEARGEITDLSGSSLVNLRTGAYDPALLTLFGLEDIQDKLPPLCYSSEFCGQVTAECAQLTGLKAGTPVAAGLFDIDACAIGMDVEDESCLAVIAGTWSINEYIARQPVLDGTVKMNSLYCLRDYYLVEECSPTSASNQEWFVNAFLREYAQAQGQGLYEAANALMAQVGPQGQRLVYLPYLYGSRDDGRARGAFVGMDASTTREQMLRAVYESVVFGHKLHVDKLLASRAQPPQAVRLAGGVVNCPLWVQMFADILELPVVTIDVKELGALGAAMTAAVAAGAYSDLRQAAQAMVLPDRTYQPDPRHRQLYRDKYAQFLAVDKALSGVWAQLGGE